MNGVIGVWFQSRFQSWFQSWFQSKPFVFRCGSSGSSMYASARTQEVLASWWCRVIMVYRVSKYRKRLEPVEPLEPTPAWFQWFRLLVPV